MNVSVFGLGYVAGVDARTAIPHVSSLPCDTVKCQVAPDAIQEGPEWAAS